MKNHELKSEIRVLGIDDGPFEKFNNRKNVLVVGVVFRGGLYFEGLVSTKVRVDGLNATRKIIDLINKSKFKPQLQAVMFDGISLGGFNVLDVEEIYKKTNIPVIIIMRKKPDFERFFKALKHTSKYKLRKKIIEKAGVIKRVSVANKNIRGFVYYQSYGCESSFAEKIINLTTTRSLIPEPLRIAHLIASGIIEGQSRGRA